ncbi:MAG: hypothetical protein JNM56_20530 [Planctomycetia bacterium]|nr:hypothetical protein [Planctomycetia bacterium]
MNADLGWSSQHRGDGLSRIGDEAVMITGDGNLIELQATVRYTVERKYLHTFLFGVRDPDAAVRGAAEAVLREAVASQPFLDLLTVNRERFQEQVLARLRQRWQSPEYGAAGLGIRLDGLSLHDLHPPQEVVEAYHAVAKAMEQRDLKVNLAQAEAIRLRREAEADELRTVREAEATAEKKVREAETARDGFLARWRARSELPAGEEWRLLSEAAMSISQGQDADAAYRAYQQRRQEQLATQAYLTDFRLSLRMLGDSLKGRDKVIVDSPKVPGRRHLMLFDPDWFKAPAPIMLPPDRGMPERSRLKDHEN